MISNPFSLRFLAVLAVFAGFFNVAQAQPFPFVLPLLDDSPSATDLSALNAAPAGRDGFIRTRNEHFLDGRGQKIRFWGVNLNYAACFPPKSIAPLIAGRLAKFGFNSVRIHQFDTSEGRSLVGATIFKTRVGANGLPEVVRPLEIDPVQQDRLDFLLAELIKRGIYINFNLHVARTVAASDGFENADLLPDKDKGIAALDARLESNNRDWARTILTHINPYTGRALKDEPGLCALEVDNENSILALWLDGTLTGEGQRAFPDPYAGDLRALWNVWLRAKYPSESAFRRAWTEASEPIAGPELLVATNTPTPAPPSPVSTPQPTPTPVSTPQPAAVPPDAQDGSVLVPQAAPEETNLAPEIGDGAASSKGKARVPTLRGWSLSRGEGALGSAAIDELAGPTEDGQTTPGLSVRMDRAGGNSWAFQLVHGALQLESGKLYTMRFWARADTQRTISLNVWEDRRPFRWLGVTQNIPISSEWREYSIGFRPLGAVPGQVRVVLNLGNSTGVFQLGAPSLRAGGRISAPDEWTLRQGVPIISAQFEPIFAARRDMAEFLASLEARHVASMRAFLRDELGVRVPIWHTQISFGGWGGVLRETQSDAFDIHAYWKHPTTFGPNWKVENVSMTASPLDDPLAAFGLGRMGGKPFVCTEWNAGQPSDFGAETLLMAATHAAQNDWGGLWIFDYHSNGLFDRNLIEGFFSIDSHPAKMATAPAAALIFRRFDVQETPVSQTLFLGRDKMIEETANAPLPPQAGAFLKTWSASGASPSPYRPGQTSVLRVPVSAITGRTQVENKTAVFVAPSRASLESPLVFRSETGEVVRDGDRDLWKVSTPRSKLWAGFWGRRRLEAGELEARFEALPAWSAGALSSLDGMDLMRSGRMLLTVVGKAENQMMRWNSARDSVRGWGEGPTIVEVPVAEFLLHTTRLDLKVYALDVTGTRKYAVPSRLKNGKLRFRPAREHKTVWFEIAP